MPHYSDGQIAKLGDLVKGKPYNFPHEITGVVVGVVPDSESCNVRVAFTRPYVQGDYLPSGYDSSGNFLKWVQFTGYDPNVQEPQKVVCYVDYGETKAFELLERKIEAVPVLLKELNN